jgi:nitrogen fixation protein FixH
MAAMTEDTMTSPEDSGFRLTGRHVLITLIVFFGVVFAVNFTMMHYATSTFSGLEDDSPYKNGLAYNTNINAGRKQNERGWKVDASITPVAEDETRIVVQTLDAQGAAITGLAGTVRLERPADRRLDLTGALSRTGDGRYQANVGAVAKGQWDLVIELERDGERLFLSRNRVILK